MCWFKMPHKPDKHYYGLTEGPFKTRFNGHTHSFCTESCRRETELSKYIWELKDNNQPYEINWSIAQHAAAYKCGTRRCDICLTEKTVIAAADPASTLNKQAEIISTCRHRAKFRYDRASGAPKWWVSRLGPMWGLWAYIAALVVNWNRFGAHKPTWFPAPFVMHIFY